MDFLKIIDETEIGFKTIANLLINHYAIQTHDSLFRMIDLEFYWNSETHEDKSTYKRNYVNPKSGDWFFHYSGVDIALKDEVSGGHGGILIRGIYDTNEKRIYKGPMICAMRLFSGTSAFEDSIKTRIVTHKFDEKKELRYGPRKNLGQNAITSGTDQLNYRFFITP